MKDYLKRKKDFSDGSFLVADGAYSGEKNSRLASEHNLKFDRWEQKVLEIMGELMRVLYDYAHNHRYLRNSEYEDD